MNAPDKIYVPQHNIEAESIYELCEFVIGGSVEYIRKDVLLEWTKEQEEKLVSDSFTSLGKRKMLKRLIDKIESL